MKVINRCSISIVMGCAFALLSVNVGFGMHKAAPKKGDQAHPKYAAPKKHPAAAPKKAPASVAPKIPATAVPLAADQENNLAHNNGHVNKPVQQQQPQQQQPQQPQQQQQPQQPQPQQQPQQDQGPSTLARLMHRAVDGTDIYVFQPCTHIPGFIGHGCVAFKNATAWFLAKAYRHILHPVINPIVEHTWRHPENMAKVIIGGVVLYLAKPEVIKSLIDQKLIMYVGGTYVVCCVSAPLVKKLIQVVKNQFVEQPHNNVGAAANGGANQPNGNNH